MNPFKMGIFTFYVKERGMDKKRGWQRRKNLKMSGVILSSYKILKTLKAG